ncbi:MAG: GrpB family protein [Pyrinomonadaceae bacterium]
MFNEETENSSLLVAHDPDWKGEFAALRAVFERSLDDLILGIEHVGSTAVPGLLAKPILDIDIVMRDYSVFPPIVEKLSELGYEHKGDQGIPGREAFKPKSGPAPVVVPPRAFMRHHLYVCPASGAELRRHLNFRDALLARGDLRREYEKMKASIAERSNGDKGIYAKIKEAECREFVERVLTEYAGLKGPDREFSGAF